MKNKLVSGIALLLLLAIAAKVYADTYSVTANNNSSQTIGTVTINLSDGTHPPLQVGSMGQYSMPLSNSAVSITINGQTINVGSGGNITLSNSSVVNVSVTSGENITISIVDAGS